MLNKLLKILHSKQDIAFQTESVNFSKVMNNLKKKNPLRFKQYYAQNQNISIQYL